MSTCNQPVGLATTRISTGGYAQKISPVTAWEVGQVRYFGGLRESLVL